MNQFTEHLIKILWYVQSLTLWNLLLSSLDSWFLPLLVVDFFAPISSTSLDPSADSKINVQ